MLTTFKWSIKTRIIWEFLSAGVQKIIIWIMIRVIYFCNNATRNIIILLTSRKMRHKIPLLCLAVFFLTLCNAGSKNLCMQINTIRDRRNIKLIFIYGFYLWKIYWNSMQFIKSKLIPKNLNRQWCIESEQTAHSGVKSRGDADRWLINVAIFL